MIPLSWWGQVVRATIRRFFGCNLDVLVQSHVSDASGFSKRRRTIIIQCTHEGHMAKVKVELLEQTKIKVL